MPPRSEGLLENGTWEAAKHDSVSSAVANLRRSASSIRPLFLKKTQNRGKLRPTAYLDGLRGVACLIVYIGHHELWAHDSSHPEKILENGWGFEKRYYFAALPVVRNIFSGGHFAVSVFFIMSGYVISLKPLQLIQARQYEALSDSMGSALFRRYMRLYIPVIASTFISLSMWHVLGISANFEPEKTYWREIVKWYKEFANFSFVFRQGGNPWFSYSFHIWSIPVEVRGSFVVYCTLMALSRARKNARLWCEVIMIYYFMYITDAAHFAMFLTGTLLCDLDLLESKGELPEFFDTFRPYKTPIFTAMFVVSQFLGGSPATSDVRVLLKTPGWRYVAWMKPQAVFDYKWFFLYWAAAFLVASVPRLPWLKTFFEHPFNMYLGRISFAFYAIHGPLLWTIGDRIYAAVGFSREAQALSLPGWLNKFPLPQTPPWGMELAFILPQIILLPINFWAGELLTRYVDDPVIKYTGLLYNYAIGYQPSDAVVTTKTKEDAPVDKKIDPSDGGANGGAHDGANGSVYARGRSNSSAPS